MTWGTLPAAVAGGWRQQRRSAARAGGSGGRLMHAHAARSQSPGRAIVTGTLIREVWACAAG